MKAQPALVRADGAVHLDAKAPVHLDVLAVVDPRNPEDDDAFGLHHAVGDTGIEIFRVAIEERPHRLDHFVNCLMELVLCSGFRYDVIHERCQ